MAKTKTRIRRTFTSEYKLQAVQLVTEKGFSYAEAARQLGLRDTQIRSWKKQFDAEGSKAFPGQGNTVDTHRWGTSPLRSRAFPTSLTARPFSVGKSTLLMQQIGGRLLAKWPYTIRQGQIKFRLTGASGKR